MLALTRSTDRDLRHLAVTCLGHVGRLDGQVLPEVVPHLAALLDDPELARRLAQVGACGGVVRRVGPGGRAASPLMPASTR